MESDEAYGSRRAVRLIATRKSEQNHRAIDPWTVVHVSAGLALGLMDIDRGKALALAVGYELAEQVFERRPWGRELFKTSGPEILPNAAVDLAVFWGGHVLGTLWNATE